MLKKSKDQKKIGMNGEVGYSCKAGLWMFYRFDGVDIGGIKCQ